MARCVACAAAALVAMVMLLFLFGPFHGHITGFFRIGDVRPPAPALAGQAVHIFPKQAGYDGQYYLALALDPALRNPKTLDSLDHPAYRSRRILLPLLGHALGLGQPALIPYALPLINATALIVLVWLAALWLQGGGRSGWLGLLVLALPGAWEALALTTTDLLCSALVLATLLALRRQRPAFAAVLLALAALTRETALLYWVAILGALLCARQWRSLLWLLPAGLPAAAWNFYLLHYVPAGEGGNVVQILFGAPGAGWLQRLRWCAENGLAGKNLFELFVFVTLVAAFIVLLWNLWWARADRAAWPAAAIALLLGGMFLCAQPFLLRYHMDYSRVFLDLTVLLVLSLGWPRTARVPTFAVLALLGIGACAFLLHYTIGKV
ncbi:MAG: hypothetical protein NTY53_11035 [Kiritimatiellaeota bacterium]|nr:hypothetical protein [Kiritimatiellota bacterium]